MIETPTFDRSLLRNPSVAVAILHAVVERLGEVQARLDGATTQVGAPATAGG